MISFNWISLFFEIDYFLLFKKNLKNPNYSPDITSLNFHLASGMKKE